MNKTLSPLIIGWGSQGKAWALNLRDSGHEVTIALREKSHSFENANELGFKTISLSDDLKQYDLILMLIPDHQHLDFLKSHGDKISPNSRIIYAHGASNVQYKINDTYSKLSHLLLAPKAIASEVRFSYQTKKKLGACYYGETSEDIKLLRELATAIGIGEILIETSFKEETYADLFSEQSVLCSLLPYGAMHSFNELRKRGVKPEIAYMECWLEVKLIAQAMVDMGPTEFFKLISPNALLGGEKAQKLIFDKAYQEKLKLLCSDIWEGTFLEQIEKTDFEKVRTDVENFWKNTELEKVHKEIAHKLK